MNIKKFIKVPGFVGWIILLCCMLSLPLVLREFQLDIVIFLLVNLILVVSFRLINTMGLFSFAHIAFMGVGGYISGLLATRLGWPFWLALPGGVAAAALTSFVIGLPCLKTIAFQFFIATFAAGEAIRWTWIIFREPFGSYAGVAGIPRPNLPGVDFTNPTSYYYLALGFTLLSLIIMYRLEKSRIGDTLKSIASSQQLCESMGINTYRYKTMTFVIGSSFAGLAGVLLANFMGTASPDTYNFTYGVNILIFALVGGIATFSGPIIGLVVLTVIGEWLRNLQEYLPLVYGVILAVVMLFLPGGLQSIPEGIFRKIRIRLGVSARSQGGATRDREDSE